MLDLAAGLTQVVSDGSNDYLYGLDLIAQTNGADIQYFLGDALGSVRQLTDASGTLILPRNYDPFGNPWSVAGEEPTIFGYTGQQTDPIGMVYLRARYYQPSIGRFVTRDTWDRKTETLMIFNKWLYGNDSPVNFTDPAGLYPLELIEKQIPLDAFDLSAHQPNDPYSSKWGFLDLLLHANDFNSVELGTLNLVGLYPGIRMSDWSILWTLNCKTIMVGNKPLKQYYEDDVKRQRQSFIWWRDTSPSYYYLFSNSQKPTVFVDGTPSPDLPDIHGFSFGFYYASVGGLIDRFGNGYVTGGGGLGIDIGLSYIEIYVQKLTGLPNFEYENDLDKRIPGICAGLEAQAVGGNTKFSLLGKHRRSGF